MRAAAGPVVVMQIFMSEFEKTVASLPDSTCTLSIRTVMPPWSLIYASDMPGNGNASNPVPLPAGSKEKIGLLMVSALKGRKQKFASNIL